MTLRERALGAVVSGARPLLPLLGLASRELGRAAAERRSVVDRLEEWSRAHRDPGRPLVWLHGASAGELTGAGPVVEALRAGRSLQLMVSYFSPSAEPVLGRLSPDVAEVLPLDTPRETRRAVAAVEPDVLVFAKGDLWPNLTRSARRAGVPLALVNGTVRPGSSRLRPPARWLLRPAYRRLDRAGAASEEDARRLRELGVPPGRLTVAGDAAADQALARVRGARDGPGAPARRLRRMVGDGAPVVMGGSSWGPDEELLLEAAAELARRGLPVRAVLVPHEPGRDAVGRIRRSSERHLGRTPRIWSEEGAGAGEHRGPGTGDPGEAPPAPVVVDVVGVLAELYPVAELAWVGGAVGGTGLHSVLEPAAAGIPVLYGTAATRREAREMEEAGAAAAVAADRATSTLGRLLRDEAERRRMGRAARRYVEERSGGAGAGARLVAELLERRGDGG